MSGRLFAAALTLALPALGAATVGPPAARFAAPWLAADTILKPDLDVPGAAVRAGLSASVGEPSVRLGLRRIPVPEGRIGPPPEAQIPLVLEPLVDAALRWRVAELTAGQISGPAFLPPESSRAVAEPEAGRFVTDYADLALNVTSRMELGGNWTRFRPCDNQFRVSCNPSAIPQLSPDLLFGVQMNGTIADRIHVDVDFDQAREFDAANRINIVYQGDTDDLLQRLEVGDVNFNLPRSRFLTQGIPAGNFGFQASGQVGAVDFQGVWAQQRGDLNSRVFQLAGFGDQRAFVQEDTLVLDDADYVRGQFFFLVDPTLIDKYPHIDALALDPASAPPSVAPGDQPIQLYRYENDPALQQQVEGFIQADAEADADGDTVVESGWFRYLQEGVDYFVHPSGLWIALRTPLTRDEMLAVTYITATGDTIGDYNPERIHNAGGRPVLRLLKASGANHQPGRPTWNQEMHQVYRVSSSPDVEPQSVDLTISLGELSAGRTFKRRPSGEDITFLRLFGLDEEAPTDQIDPSFVYSPAAELFAAEPLVQGTFVVFPTLRPFAEPPPIPSLGITETVSAQILGDDANPRVYYEEDPFERDNAGRFRLTLAYRLRSEGVISSFSLGAFGIRDGSERIMLGDRLLTRGTDYEIDYDVGQVRLLEPDLLFASAPDASIRATWEQRSLFQVVPTQVFGLRTHADLGEHGGIDLLGLYQSERTVVSRPLLGTEPGAALLGGLSGSYATDVSWLNGLLNVVPGLGVDEGSRFSMDGEIALSMPNPNTRGRAFIDDFDATSQLPVSLLSSDWVLGSAPTLRDGVDAVLPAALDAATASPLVWQHTWVIQSSTGDSIGVHEGYYPHDDIDHQIRVAGTEVREPALRLAFGSALDGGGNGWRSITTSLSANGLDLTKTEFLEFYVAVNGQESLVVDLGTVSEDAFFVDGQGNTTGPRPDGGQWGLGMLDQEADPRKGEIWSDALDQLGVWGESCVAERGRIYPPGDLRADCTRSNGRPDTEDLDADGNLDTAERHLRFLVTLDGTSPYLERTTTQTGTRFQLYRIPIRASSAVEVGGPVGDAELRAVRQLRVTVAGGGGVVELARMRLVGSRWIKRDVEGVLFGIAGDTLTSNGHVEVSPVSRVTEGQAYTSPPGVLEELEDPTTAYAGQAIEFNEKSLGVTFTDLPAGARAEVYQRFPQRPRNFLAYGEARLWVVARSGDFGPDRPSQFFIKVGNDSENFYLYRASLSPPPGGSSVASADWLPEIRVDFDRWFDLRLQAEQLIGVGLGPGDPPVEVWSSDSTYAVVLKDRGRAPNLAAVREMSLGVWNGGSLPTSGEIWVDELRLGAAVRDPGLAGSLDVQLDAGGVLDTRLSVTDRGAFFRQLRDDPTYQTDRTLSLVSSLALDRWMPAAWGLDMPVTLELGRTSQSPRFLAASDVRADRLAALRPTEEHRTRVGVAFRKRTQSASPVVGFLVDGLDANASYTTSRGSTVTTEHNATTFDASLGWVRDPTIKSVPVFPGVTRAVLRALLPGFLEDAVADARLRLTPEHVSVGTSYFRQDSRIFRFQQIFRTPGDAAAVPTLVPRETVQTVADVRLRPFRPLTAEVALLTARDLLRPDQAAADPAVQSLIRAERAKPVGLDLGWETNRSLRSSLAYRPTIFSWLRNDFDWTTVYQSERNTNFVERVVTGPDTTVALTRSARGERDWGATVAVDPSRIATVWFGEGTPDEAPGVSRMRAIMRAIRPLAATYRDGITSRFNRDPIDPGYGYQLGWGSESDFRFLGADTAATLTDRSTWQLGSGLGLPGGAGVQVGYERTDATTLDTRSDRRAILTTWPDVRASLPTFSPGAGTGIRSINVSSGLTRTLRTIDVGGRAAQGRRDKDIRIPVQISIQWLRTLVTSYEGALRWGTGSDPTGETERDETSHRVSVTTQLLPPGWIARRLDRPISVSLLGAYTSERTCRNTTAQSECVAFVDQLGRTLNLSMNTGVRGFDLGLQMSFDDRQSFVGQQRGSTQFQVGIWGQLNFTGGTIPFGG